MDVGAKPIKNEVYNCKQKTTDFSVVLRVRSDVLLSQGEAPNYHRR